MQVQKRYQKNKDGHGIGAGVSRSENQLELALSDVSFRSASPDALARHRQASLNFGRIVCDAQAPYTFR